MTFARRAALKGHVLAPLLTFAMLAAEAGALAATVPSPSPTGPLVPVGFSSFGNYFEVDNTGSSNTLGFRVLVRRDGAAQTFVVARGLVDLAHGQEAAVDKTAAEAVISDLEALGPFPPPEGRPCMHSASFGSSTTVFWKGERSPVLECSGPAYASLRRDVATVVGQLRLPALGRRAPIELRPAAPSTGSP